MATINVKTTSIQVYSNGDSIRYRLNIDTSIEAIVKKDNEYVIGNVEYIDFVPRVLIAQCLAQIEGLDLMYTKKKEQGLRNEGQTGFGAAELQVVLRGAILTIERIKFGVGDEYTTSDGEVLTHEHDGYNTNIVNIKVSDKIQSKLDMLIDKIFDL